MMVVLMLCCTPAGAQTVVLVRPPKTEAVLTDAFNRLKAELNLQLFEIIVIDSCSTDPCPNLVELTMEHHASAAVQLQPLTSGSAADLCLIDRASGEPTTRRLELDDNQDAPAVLALRTGDLLRSGLREVSKPSPPPAAPARPAKVERSAPLVERPVLPARRTSLRLGLALLDAAPALSTAFGLQLNANRLLTQRLRLGVVWLGPTVGAAFKTASGNARVRQELAAFQLGFALLPRPPVELWADLGLGLFHLAATADTPPDIIAKRGQLYSLLGSLNLSCAYPLSERIALEVETSFLTLTPRPGIAVTETSMLYRRWVWSSSLGTRMTF